MDKHTFTLESFKNIQELIRFSDQKAAAVLVVAGLEMTVYFGAIDKLTFNKNYTSVFSILTLILGICTAIFLLATIYLTVFKVLHPRLAKHYSGNDASLFYFNHLASMTDKTDMFNQFNRVTDAVMLRNLTDQIFEVSKILNAKTNGLYYSIYAALLSMGALSIFILSSKFI